MKITLSKKSSGFLIVISLTIVVATVILMNFAKMQFSHEIQTMDMFQINGEGKQEAIAQISQEFDIQSIQKVGEDENSSLRIYVRSDKDEIMNILDKFEDIEFTVQKSIPQFVFPTGSAILFALGLIVMLIILSYVFLQKSTNNSFKSLVVVLNILSYIPLNFMVLLLMLILSMLGWQISVFSLYIFASILFTNAFILMFLFKVILDLDQEVLNLHDLKTNIDMFIKTNFDFLCKILLVLTAFALPIVFIYDFTVEIGLVILAFWITIFGYLILSRSYCDILSRFDIKKLKSLKKKR